MQRAQFSRVEAFFQLPVERMAARMRAMSTKSPRELSFRNSFLPTLKLMGMPLFYPSWAYCPVFVEGDGDFFDASDTAGAKGKLQKKSVCDVVAEILVEDEIAERIVDRRIEIRFVILNYVRMRTYHSD